MKPAGVHTEVQRKSADPFQNVFGRTNGNLRLDWQELGTCGSVGERIFVKVTLGEVRAERSALFRFLQKEPVKTVHLGKFLHR